MRANREGLLNKLPTVATCLCGEARVDSDDLMSSVCSFGFKDSQERAPGSIMDAFSKVMVLDHVGDLKVFYCNQLIAFSIGFSRPEMMVTALAGNLEMRLCDVTCSLALAVAVEDFAWCAAAHEVAVVAAARVVVHEPAVDLGLELADAHEPAAVERRPPAFLERGALEPFADRVVVR